MLIGNWSNGVLEQRFASWSMIAQLRGRGAYIVAGPPAHMDCLLGKPTSRKVQHFHPWKNTGARWLSREGASSSLSGSALAGVPRSSHQVNPRSLPLVEAI